jgi:hypothetical protein
MLEQIHGIPQRIASLKAKLKAREGKSEFRENVVALRAEIERLESVSQNRASLAEFVESEAAVASPGEGEQ